MQDYINDNKFSSELDDDDFFFFGQKKKKQLGSGTANDPVHIMMTSKSLMDNLSSVAYFKSMEPIDL